MVSYPAISSCSFTPACFHQDYSRDPSILHWAGRKVFGGNRIKQSLPSPLPWANLCFVWTFLDMFFTVISWRNLVESVGDPNICLFNHSRMQKLRECVLDKQDKLTYLWGVVLLATLLELPKLESTHWVSRKHRVRNCSLHRLGVILFIWGGKGPIWSSN